MKNSGSNDFRIDLAGTMQQHSENFVIDRPNGAEFYIFVHFEVPVEVKISGSRNIYPAGSFLLFEPRFPHWYRGYQTGLCDNWLHIHGTRTAEIYTNCGLVINKVVDTVQTDFIHEFIGSIEKEVHTRDKYTDRSCELIFERMCIEASRHTRRRTLIKTDKTKARHLKNLDLVRERIHSTFRQHWTVEKMAEMAEISESRFAVLYREFYSISPLNDLIEIRLRYARYLLSNTTLSVKDVAEKCGFENSYYFGRLFKKRIGTTPGKYHLTRTKPENNL